MSKRLTAHQYLEHLVAIRRHLDARRQDYFDWCCEAYLARQQAEKTGNREGAAYYRGLVKGLFSLDGMAEMAIAELDQIPGVAPKAAPGSRLKLVRDNDNPRQDDKEQNR